MANTTGLKFGGRTKGSLNKTTAETKELLQKIVSKEIDNLGELLEQLDPLERVNAIAKFLPFIVAKQSEVSLLEQEPPRKIIIKIPRRNNE
ncbi:hypothetical protein [Flavobacterium sp. GP15]|uniref:hypothetical protein n=1 Tax=Flavobacterium sp. GP15 TaxID=2758567 RepID=UPI00165DE1F0|nr:hypothetical protein [Flavobacterium sp. GP15]